MFVDESYTPNPPEGDCGSEEAEQGDANSDACGIFGPDLYSLTGSVPNPCSMTSTQSFKVTLDGAVHDIVTKHLVTWAYSGVTVTCTSGCEQ